jgi:hypothetical protein
MPSDVAGQRSLVRVIDLRCAVLYAQIQASGASLADLDGRLG